MEEKKPKRHEFSFVYPAHRLTPEDLLTFIESKVFEREWSRLGLTIDDLFGLQLGIMIHPKGPPVVQGTGGLRKLRFSPRRSAHGKSGSHRACYVYYEDFGTVLLVTAYSKNQIDDLSPAGKKAIRRMIQEQQKLSSARGTIT